MSLPLLGIVLCLNYFLYSTISEIGFLSPFVGNKTETQVGEQLALERVSRCTPTLSAFKAHFKNLKRIQGL